MSLPLPALTIPDAATVSNALSRDVLKWLRSITIYPPAALSGVVTVEVSDKDAADAVAADYRDLQSGGSDVNITADDSVTIEHVAGFGALRLRTSVAPSGADETHDVTGEELAFTHVFG